MLFNENDRQGEQDERAAENAKATGYRVDDNNGTEERDLKGNPLFGSGEMRGVREGQPMGGQSFGEDGNPTPTGDDKDNPSRNAGYTNGYFARTKPSEEYTADNNFKSPDQQGSADYDKAQASVGRLDNLNDQQTETGNESNQTNIAGPQEVPKQQNVGENGRQIDDDDHIET
jgi:hypothetical protein